MFLKRILPALAVGSAAMLAACNKPDAAKAGGPPVFPPTQVIAADCQIRPACPHAQQHVGGNAELRSS